MNNRVPVATIKALLQAEGDRLIAELCPGGRREGHIWSAPNPTRANDTIGSFKVWLGGATHGVWKEYDANEAGDIIDLVAYAKRLTRGEAIAWSKHRLGLDDAPPAVVKARQAQAIDRVKASNEADEARRRRRTAYALSIAAEAVPVLDAPDSEAGRAVLAYLAGRGIDLAAVETLERREIRASVLEHWMSATYQAEKKTAPGWIGPAMVCPITNGAGEVTGVHCTWIRPDGKGKAPVPNAKLMLGQVLGSVIRIARGDGNLSVEEACGVGALQRLVITEGIEDALSIAMVLPELRVWAASSLGNLGNVPAGLLCVDGVIVAADNDWGKPQALAAFDKAIDQLQTHGKPVAVMRSHGNAKDFNDLLRG